MEFSSSKNEMYKKNKPVYSAALYDYLYSAVNISKDSVIADIGTGTGIFCRPMLERGSTVYGVEPDEKMLEIAKNDLSEYSKFISIASTAENTGLLDVSVDFITAAESFHLYDRELFKKESKRILKPGGKVILCWNTHAAFKWGGKYNELALKYNKIFRKYKINLKMADPKKLERYFKDGVYEKMEFDNDLIVDKGTFIGMHVANSYSPSPRDGQFELYQEFCRSFSEVFDEFAVAGQLYLPTATNVYIGEVL